MRPTLLLFVCLLGSALTEAEAASSKSTPRSGSAEKPSSSRKGKPPTETVATTEQLVTRTRASIVRIDG
ncbi:MAG: hypothetical protein ACKOKG_06740, partial [Verrucomicrobiota bacterium]